MLFDASAFVPIFVPGPVSEVAGAYFAREEVVSLSFAAVEVSSALVQEMRFHGMTQQSASDAFDHLSGLVDWLDSRAFTQAAMPMAVSYQHGVYDCHYVAAAQSLRVPLITADKKLARKFADAVPAGIICLYDEITAK
ncbi:type II toxin-antitoxin system VapC family toxin [Roseitalea porphyridii]|uniref:Ribonuclease VapC n=1 Tax=Roseitalea porphyridii TaxID=1852022 RepID=A0A4P6UYJ8_9HYPH|nr:type II toxin-antitoxin system VapC family toxin [Roseitalea porphyridii]QBK30121.1 PIN domain-containing protein [Roseitalea porphyridii]